MIKFWHFNKACCLFFLFLVFTLQAQEACQTTVNYFIRDPLIEGLSHRMDGENPYEITTITGYENYTRMKKVKTGSKLEKSIHDSRILVLVPVYEYVPEEVKRAVFGTALAKGPWNDPANGCGALILILLNMSASISQIVVGKNVSQLSENYETRLVFTGIASCAQFMTHAIFSIRLLRGGKLAMKDSLFLGAQETFGLLTTIFVIVATKLYFDGHSKCDQSNSQDNENCGANISACQGLLIASGVLNSIRLVKSLYSRFRPETVPVYSESLIIAS